MIYNKTKYNKHWKIKKLNELGKFCRGKSTYRPRNDPKLYENGKYPLVQTGDVKVSNFLISKYKKKYNEFGLKQSRLWKKGTLCITIAANIAETGILAYPMCFPDSIVGFNSYPEKSSEAFMHYIFTYIRNSIQNSIIGSIQDNINIEYLSNLYFMVPEKPYQDKIVQILSLLDKKIMLNNQIIDELESMAIMIYDYWFIQFDFPNDEGKPYKSSGGRMVWNKKLNRMIPTEWRLSPIEDQCEIVDCLHSAKPSFKYENEKYYLLQLENIIEHGLIDLNKKYYISKKMYGLWTSRIELEEGDIVITNAGRIGSVSRAPANLKAAIGRNMTAIRPKNIPPVFLYYFIIGKDVKAQIKSNTDSGSFFGSLNVRGIKKLYFLLPPKEKGKIINIFEEKILPYRLNIENLMNENQELIKLRDWLLPMLINGQVTIK